MVDQFVEWVTARGCDASTAVLMDRCLANFFSWKFAAGYSPAAGQQARAGIIHLFPRYRDQLPESLLALKGWEKVMPPNKHPPLTWFLSIAMALRAVSWGYPEIGCAILVGFHLFLRFGELLNIHLSDIADPNDLRFAAANNDIVIRLRHTKTGTNQGAHVDDPAIIKLIRVLKRVRSSTAKQADPLLFNVSPFLFRRVFGLTVRSWEIPDNIVPHSLRHGGATHALKVQKVSAETVKERGRWASQKAFSHYIQGMEAALLQLRAPSKASELGVYVASDLFRAFCFASEMGVSSPLQVQFRKIMWDA